MLRATHSVLKPGAPNCFYVITHAEDISEADRERLANRDGDEHVNSPTPYEVLMHEAGFVDIQLTDVTVQYAKTLEAWKLAWEADADALIALLGEEDLLRRINNRTQDIANIEDGLLRRYLVYGTKP